MDYEPVANLNEVLPGLLALLAGVAAHRADRLVLRADDDRPAAARRLRRWLVATAVSLLGVLGAVGLNVAWGWDMVEHRVLVALPPVVVPAVLVAVLTVPRLFRTTPAAVTAERAADPRLVAPVEMLAVGALLCLMVSFVIRPVPPYTPTVCGVTLVAFVAWGALWFRSANRAQRVRAGALRHAGPWRRSLRAIAVVAALAALGTAGIAYGAAASRMPDRLAMGPWDGGHDHTTMAMAGTGSGDGAAPARSVTELTGPRAGRPDAAFTLVAAPTTVHLPSGRTMVAWTYNGTTPGPELRVRQGDLVQATLVNRLPQGGVTLHWHGLDVPNAEDGVPGMTQDTVRPGQTFTYRFRAEQAGSFWYHSHSASSEQVRRGLFGALVVLPRAPQPLAREMVAMAHLFPAPDGGQFATLGSSDGTTRQAVAPGTPVRLRLMNTSSRSPVGTEPSRFALTGAPFRVEAIDGTPVHGPTDLRDATLPLATGGRYDLTFVMADHPVLLADVDHPGVGMLLGPTGREAVPPLPASGPVFEPTTYGTPAPTPFTAAGPFDRDYTLTLDDGPGFYNGRFFLFPKINGVSFPKTGMLTVREGDLVRTTIVNRSHNDHPMHLHGHHVLVLSRDGVPTTGAPWWADSLEVEPGQTVQTAFRADNPGIWMDHCHNLYHAVDGMMMHLAYEGVTTPFEMGTATGNDPA